MPNTCASSLMPQLTAAHERLSASRNTYLRTTEGRLWGKPANGIESKYLLAGLTHCAVCGGGLYVASRHGRARAYFYACATFHRKGHTICPNNRQVAMETADWAVMEAVQDELLDPLVVATALREAFATLTASPEHASDRILSLRTRERELSDEIDRLTAAIAAGGELAGLVDGMKHRERERQRTREEREQLERVVSAPLDLTTIERELLARVSEWRTMAARTVAQGRQILRKLLRGRVTATPRDDGTVELSGQADY